MKKNIKFICISLLMAVMSVNAWGYTPGEGYTKVTNPSSQLDTYDQVILYEESTGMAVTGSDGTDATLSATEAAWTIFNIQYISGSTVELADVSSGTRIRYLSVESESTHYNFVYTSLSGDDFTINGSGLLQYSGTRLAHNGNNVRFYGSAGTPLYVYKLNTPNPFTPASDGTLEVTPAAIYMSGKSNTGGNSGLFYSAWITCSTENHKNTKHQVYITYEDFPDYMWLLMYDEYDDETAWDGCFRPTSNSYDWVTFRLLCYAPEPGIFHATLTYTEYGTNSTVEVPIVITVTSECTSQTVLVYDGASDESKTVNYGALSSFDLSYMSDGTGTVTWTSTNTNVATVVGDGSDGATVTIVGAGSTNIKASVEADATYCAAEDSYPLTVNVVAPTVSDFTVTSYTNNTLTISNANASQITNKGGANITRYGYIYSTTASTTSTLTFGASGVTDAKVGTDNIALNTNFAAKDITGLSAGTTYYVRAYAYNGTAYGYSPNIRTVTTKCAVTYAANGGTGTTVDASSPYEKLSDVTVIANGFTPPAGKKFVDWLGSDANHYDPGDVINDISTDMTLTAQWEDATYEKYIFACAEISVASSDAGKALVTSSYHETNSVSDNINIMATNPIKVTVSGAVSGHRVTFTNSVGLHFYKKVEGTGGDAGKYKYIEATGANSFVAPLTAQEVYVSYQPTSAGTGAILSELPFTISCDGESQEFNKAGEYIKARNLPSSVAIVANVGGSWHGLSANITSSSTPKDKMIAVATDGGILKAYGPSDDFGYKLWPVRTVNSSYDRSGYTYSSGYPAKLYGDRLRFAGKDNKGLMANNNESSNKYNINNYGAITVITAYFEHDENYEWKVTTREENGQFVYTLQSDQTNNNRYLRLWNDRWGTYLDERGTEDVYILPLVETALVDMQPFEWGTDQVVVCYTPGATPVALTGVNMGSDEAASPTFTQLGTSDLWSVSGLTGMADKPAQQLQVKITENGTPKQGLLQIPLIVDGTSTEAELRSSLPGSNATEKNKVAKNTDVVILSGGEMTTNTNSGNFKDLYIYAGGKAIITNTMSFGDIYMRGGFGYIGDETWDVARAKIDAAVSLGDEGKLYYDLTIDGTKYYDLAVPYEVDLTATTDDKGDGDFNVWMKVYDGTLRANTGKGWTWYDWNGDLLLHPGTGYLIEATPRYSRSYCTIRFPMSPDLSSGEAEKDPFAVTAPGMNADGSIATGKVPNNVGWNFIANPYMCNFGTDDMSEGKDGTLKLGQLVEHRPDGVWDGTYEWDTEGEKNIRYVTTFDYNTQHYEQHPLSSTVLDPFTGFFVQIAKAGSLNFTSEGRQLSAPAIMLASQLPNDMELVLTVSGNGYSDETRLHINNELSLADAMEFPDEMTKQLNAGVINFYTIANGINMYANGMSYEDAQEWIPAGVVAPQEGLYAFSVSGVNANYIKSVLLLDKNSGYEYDLMSVNPQLFLNNGTDDERFAVKIVLREEDETPTGLFDVQTDNTRAIKFIYRDNMYILLNGNVYDATGKRVKEINK